MQAFLAPVVFFLHDALNDTLPCFWNWKVGKPLINLEIAGTPTKTPLTPADIEHRGCDCNATTHELIEGQINGKSGKVKWSVVKVEARVRATDPPDTVKQYLPEYAGRAGGKDRWIGTLDRDADL